MEKNLQRRFTLMTALGITAAVATLNGSAPAAIAAPPQRSALVPRRSVGTPTAVPGQVLVKVPSSMSKADVASLAAQADCVVVQELPSSTGYYLLRTNAAQAQIDATAHASSSTTRKVPALRAEPVQSEVQAAVDTLQKTAGVLAQPNYIRQLHKMRRQATTPAVTTLTPNDTYYGSTTSSSVGQWDMKMIKMPEAWAIQANGVGRTVVAADIDSGIDLTHPDLINRIQPGGLDYSQYSDATIPNPTPVPITSSVSGGHGTHTAGTIAAETNNALGVASVGGWNQGGVDIKVLPLQVFAPDPTDPTAETGAPDSAIIAAINYSASTKADVINMSLGGASLIDVPDPLEKAAVDDAYNSGVTIVVSAGNDGLALGTQEFVYPALYPNVIDVSAVGPQGELAFYSNYSGNVAIAAPGGDDITFSDPNNLIMSTWPVSFDSTSLAGSGAFIAPGYAAIQGTSMAAPHVTGAVALLIANGFPRDPARIKYALQSTAQVLNEVPSFTGGNKFGAGLLNVYGALRLLTPQFAALSGSSATGTSTTNATPVNFSQTLAVPYATLTKTYGQTQDGFKIQYINNRAPTTLSEAARFTVRIDAIQSAQYPSSFSVTYTGGINGANDFDIGTVSGAASYDTVQTVVPRSGNLTLPAGNYKATLLRDNVAQGILFFEVAAYTQPVGRSMFSTPFLTTDSPTTPEVTLFGPSAVYTLSRYNVNRGPTDLDYFQFSSTGNPDQAQARLLPTITALDGTPLSFLQTSPSTSLSPVGLGYWLDIDRTTTLTPTGPTTSGPVAVKLYSANGGWNMVGDPYTYPVNWASATVAVGTRTYTLADAITAGIIGNSLVGYRSDTSYQGYLYNIAPLGSFEPFNGYWVHAYQDCTLVIPPIPASSLTGATRASRLPAINGWRGRLMATVDGDTDSENYFGEVVDAKGTANQYDVEKPPTGAGHAYVRFVKPNKKGRSESYAFDMRPTSETHEGEWTVAFSTDRPDARVTLSWDGIANAPHGADFTLTDTATGAKISLRERTSYTFKSGEAGSTRSFKLTMTARNSAGPLAISSLTLSPPSKAVQGVSLRLTTTRDAEIKALVKTFSGRTVASFGGSSTRATALSALDLHWNGRGTDGASLPVGAYLIEVTARSADGQTSTVKQVYTNIR